MDADLTKLKVTELRAELQARGLDTKGVKAQLIDRLKEALDQEQQESGLTSSVPATEVEQPAAAAEPPETPRLRRSSRSRTRSPESIATKQVQQETPLAAVSEEPEESAQSSAAQKDTEMYEKIIDEMDVDQSQPHEELDEDALLADNEQPQESSQPAEEESTNGQEQSASTENSEQTEAMETSEEKPAESGGEENRGVKRRAESPAKETSPKKRQRLPPPNCDDFVNDEDEPELDENVLQLSWFDSDLNLKIDRQNFCSAQSLYDTGLALVWAGARANYGAIANGKYFYEVQLVLFNNKISYPNEKNLHEIRCGWSTSNSPLQLGESENSFALDSSGKKCSNSEFTDYTTTRLSQNDVIGVHLELTDEKCSIAFTVNGKDCGIAFEFEKSSLDGQALFPHISTKNVEYKVNFGESDSLWTARRNGHKEQELKKRRNELERKKKEVTKKREEKAEKLKKEAEAAAAAKANAETSGESSEQQPAEVKETEEEKPAEIKEAEEEKPAEAMQEEEKPAETKQDEEKPAESVEEPEVVLPDDITEDEIDQDTPHENMLSGYTYIGKIPVDQLTKGPRRPDNRTDCEVIMMIGLPGAGKSHWALQRAKEHPEKRYTLLGTKYLLERMRIAGQPRKPNTGPGRWEKLIELCNRGLLTLNEIACKRRRNYILDQPHVYISDQRRKMRVYGDFKRIACIVVPKEEDLKIRIKQRLETEGKDIPEAAVNEMRANITLPELEYLWFNEILYSDLEKEVAGEEVSKENERGKRALNQRNRQGNFNRPGFNNRGGGGGQRWGPPGGNQQQFRRNNWGPPTQNRPVQGGNNNWNRGGNNWNNSNNWNRPARGGYGGAPPPRPGGGSGQVQQNQKRPNQQNNQQVRNFRQGGSGGNQSRGNQNNAGGQKKFGGKNWNQQGGGWGNNWSGSSGGNNYSGQGWNNQWNQNQYGGSNSSDNSGDTNQQWMAYYQQQTQNQSWFSNDGNYGGSYGGAFSSNSNYDGSQSKQ